MKATNSEFELGGKVIKQEQKAAVVKGVFDSVANQYDVMNDLMSLGIHRRWKKTFLNQLNPADGSKLLDVAGGTGDIAFAFLNRTKDSQVTVCDINEAMLASGQKRAIDKNILKDIAWVPGNAEELPFEDMSYDYYTIAFGIRNVTYIEKALAEAYRVLKPGGRFMCLEFSHVESAVLSKIYDVYSYQIIPQMGKMVVGDSEPYEYLVDSIRRFPKQEQFKRMIEEAGFSKVTYRNLTFGSVAIHSGWRL